MNDEVKKLKEYLLSLDPSYECNGGVVIRCPYCGDSDKSASSHHLNILLDYESHPIYNFPVYHCLLCHASGAVNSSFLSELNINDNGINNTLKDIIKKDKNNAVYKSYTAIDKEYHLNIPEPNLIKSNKIKIDYLRKRLGYHFSVEELITKFKVVFDLKNFLSYNGIDRISHKEYFVDILDKCYVGFLSTQNNFVIMRRIDECLTPKLKEKFPRYFNYNIFGTTNARNKFYTIGTTIDNLSNEPTEIIMSEGIMDIISSYINVFDRDEKNKVYVSVNGSGYPHTFNYIVKRYQLYENSLTILGDTGMYSNQKKLRHLDDMVFYRNIKKNIKSSLYDSKVDLLFNKFEGEKDFGVPKDRQLTVKTTI